MATGIETENVTPPTTHNESGLRGIYKKARRFLGIETLQGSEGGVVVAGGVRTKYSQEEVDKINSDAKSVRTKQNPDERLILVDNPPPQRPVSINTPGGIKLNQENTGRWLNSVRPGGRPRRN